MDAVITIWWITLAVAVVATIPALAIVVRFIHHAQEVDRLARITLAAAGGIAGNTANIVLLEQLLAHAGSLAATSAAIDGVAAKIHADAAGVVRTVKGIG
ncbi:MAG TPA: hypothetical protein VFW12_03815 [Candidatus Limnocylindria bacterium]|nr:hypothetical protein [Candidatus Limnocylindria bacterium]